MNAPKAGKITELLAEEESTVTVGQDLFKYEPGAAGEGTWFSTSLISRKLMLSPTAPSAKASEESKPSETPKEEPKPAESKETPATTAKAEEPRKVHPPPPPPARTTKESTEKPEQPVAPKIPGSRNETRVKMSRMRLRIAERLKESQNAAASLTTFNEIDMSALMEMRKRFKDQVLKEHEVKLGFMSAFARASCLALKEIPSANASIEGDEIVYRDYVDLSVAVATPKGLVTPVVRNAEQMGFIDIEKEIAALSKKARDGKLTIEDMAGGSFTMYVFLRVSETLILTTRDLSSNGGVFGSLFGTPIINLPQAAVLGTFILFHVALA